MTSRTSTAVASDKVREIAERYRGQGYEVTVAPSADQLPEVLRDLSPDLIARKDDDLVIVEVKSRPHLASAPRPSDLARVVREHPGWRFELVIVSPERPFLAPYDAEDWTAEEIGDRLSEAQLLLEAGHVEAALLLAWSATEATLRLLAAYENSQFRAEQRALPPQEPRGRRRHYASGAPPALGDLRGPQCRGSRPQGAPA